MVLSGCSDAEEDSSMGVEESLGGTPEVDDNDEVAVTSPSLVAGAVGLGRSSTDIITGRRFPVSSLAWNSIFNRLINATSSL